jgi:hypothetical protein
MLVVKTVPLAISEGFDTGVVVATCSTPRVHHHREELKSQRILQMVQRKHQTVTQITTTIVIKNLNPTLGGKNLRTVSPGFTKTALSIGAPRHKCKL